MLSLALIGFFGGLITGISPCILPVLPVIFFSGGVQGAKSSADAAAPAPSRWRPYLVISGLVVSFSIFTSLSAQSFSCLRHPLPFSAFPTSACSSTSMDIVQN